MATCIISGTIQDPSEAAIAGVTLSFRLITPLFISTVILTVPEVVTTTTASDGTFTLTLTQGCSGILDIQYPPNSIDSSRILSYAVNIPLAVTADLGDILTELI